MEMFGRKGTGSEERLNICDTCKSKRSISRAAFGYCTECSEFMCKYCFHGHQDRTPNRKHNSLVGKQMPKQRLRPVDICHKHADEEVKYFCKVHSALTCQKCAFIEHRMCLNVCDVSELLSDPKTDQRYKEIIQKIAFLESKVDDTRQTRLNNLSKIESDKKQAKADIKAFCKAMHEHLYKIEQKVDEEVDNVEEEGANTMDTVLEECDAVTADLKVLTTELETNQDPTRKDQMFIALHKAAVTVETLDEKLTTLSNGNTVREYTFEPDDRLKRVITDVERLGHLSIRVAYQSSTVKIKTPRSLDTVTIETDDGINIRTQSDASTCSITGSTMMEGDTTLAVADYGNGSANLVDIRQKTVVSQIILPSRPWDITRLQSDQLAANAKKVQFLSVTGTSLSLGRHINVAGECYGIDHNNDRLYISFDSPKQIQILSISGTVLNTITEQTDTQIQFTRPLYLTLNIDQSLLYVSDQGTNTVYFLDMNGGVKAAYTNKRLKWPRGMSAAEDGSLIVCGYNSDNVYVISPDCSRGRKLVGMSRGVQSPDSVTYSSALSTLFVGQLGSDTLKVFKLK